MPTYPEFKRCRKGFYCSHRDCNRKASVKMIIDGPVTFTTRFKGPGLNIITLCTTHGRAQELLYTHDEHVLESVHRG